MLLDTTAKKQKGKRRRGLSFQKTRERFFCLCKRHPRCIAVILLAALLAGGGWLAVDAEAYAAVAAWVLQVSERVFYRENDIAPTKYRLGVSGKDNFTFSVYASGYGFVTIQCDVASSERFPGEYNLEIDGVTYHDSSRFLYFDTETGELERTYATFYGLTAGDLSSEMYINVTNVMEKFTADAYQTD